MGPINAECCDSARYAKGLGLAPLSFDADFWEWWAGRARTPNQTVICDPSRDPTEGGVLLPPFVWPPSD